MLKALSWMFVVLWYCITGPVSCADNIWKMSKLFESEIRLLKTADRKIQKRVNGIGVVERSLSNILSETSYKVNKVDYTSTSVTALTMIRRLAEDWTALAGMIEGHLPGNVMHDLGNVRWPNGDDIEAAASAVERLQFTYNLGTALLAEGSLIGNNSLAHITGMDCFNIGRLYVKKQHYAEAVTWLQQALRKISAGDSSISHHTVLKYLLPALCYSGNLGGCSQMLPKILKSNIGFKPPDDLLYEYYNISMMGMDALAEAVENWQSIGEIYYAKEDLELHRRLCRGEVKVESGLRCRYVHYQQHHLRFQPFKLEELQLDPPVLRFVDVLSDLEAEILKKEAIRIMAPSLIFGEDGKPTQSDVRTSFAGWLDPGMSDVGDKLTRRMADMTRLDAFHAEDNQFSRYALSGGYLPHFDFYNGYVLDDRIATLMFYLNEVKQGGNTVFLNWNLSVPPVKNSAVFWFNFSPEGYPDIGSYHGGCPVLQGSKWVLNKWFKNMGGRPCDVDSGESYRKCYVQ